MTLILRRRGPEWSLSGEPAGIMLKASPVSDFKTQTPLPRVTNFERQSFAFIIIEEAAIMGSMVKCGIAVPTHAGNQNLKPFASCVRRGPGREQQ
jgi:hypothetical protein